MTMQAVVLTGHGGNEVVEVQRLPKPTRAPGEVLVRVHAATLNQVDLYMRNSGAGITHRLPQIMGLDAAGVVEACDADEPRLRVGQRVLVYPGVTCGRCEFCLRGEGVLCTSMRLMGEHRDGTFAQWVSVPAQNVLPLPDGLSFAQGAALVVNHLTAWRMLANKARLCAGESVLIFGVGGGVSLAGLQLAKAMGAQVWVTSRHADKLACAQALGADHVIHSASQDVVKTVMADTGGRGVDVVFENVGEAVWGDALRALVRGGRLVTCGATSGDQPSADLRRVFIRQLQIFGSTLGDLTELHELLRVVEQHQIQPVIDAVYPLDQVHAAFERLAAAQQFGKLVLDLS